MITLDTQLAAREYPTSQYLDFDFNSMVRFGGKFMAASSDGISILGGDRDNGTRIKATIEYPQYNLGTSRRKRLRFLYFGVELYGSLNVTIFTDNIPTGASYPIPMHNQGQQRVRVPVDRGDGNGNYFRLLISNTNGCDFSIDTIEALPVVLHRGHGFV